MKIIPAIDLLDGQCVRLLQGDYKKVTSYNISPINQANYFFKEGFRYLHIVDLDSAKNADNKNLNIIKSINKIKNLKIQVGGGIRDIQKVKDLLSEIENMTDTKVYFKNIDKLYNLRIKYDENDISSSNQADSGEGYVYVSHIQDKLEEEEIEDESKKTSKKMRDYIDHNMEKYKIMAFNEFKTEIIGKCATKINSNLSISQMLFFDFDLSFTVILLLINLQIE